MKGYFSGQDVGVWLRRVQAMSWKELLQLWRDPVLLLFIVYAFTLDIYNAGSGVTLQLNNAAFAVLDTDRSAASRELAARFLPPYFNPQGQVQNGDEGLSLLDRNQALFVLDIPPKFEASLLAGRGTAVQMQVDASNSVLATLASADATEITSAFGLEQATERLGGSTTLAGAPVLSNSTRVWFNPNQNDAWFMAISELLNVITVFGLLLPAAAMVREKERGTIEQLVVSPLTAMQVMVPKILAMTLVILAATAVAVALVVCGYFGVPFRGSVLLFFGVTTLYVVALSGLGLLIATVSRNLAQACMLAILVIAPMLFLSGAWSPPEALPVVAQWLMVISPLYYFIDVAYGVILKGAGWSVLWPSVLGIAVLGTVAMGVCLRRFRSQFD